MPMTAAKKVIGIFIAVKLILNLNLRKQAGRFVYFTLKALGLDF